MPRHSWARVIGECIYCLSENINFRLLFYMVYVSEKVACHKCKRDDCTLCTTKIINSCRIVYDTRDLAIHESSILRIFLKHRSPVYHVFALLFFYLKNKKVKNSMSMTSSGIITYYIYAISRHRSR